MEQLSGPEGYEAHLSALGMTDCEVEFMSRNDVPCVVVEAVDPADMVDDRDYLVRATMCEHDRRAAAKLLVVRYEDSGGVWKYEYCVRGVRKGALKRFGCRDRISLSDEFLKFWKIESKLQPVELKLPDSLRLRLARFVRSCFL